MISLFKVKLVDGCVRLIEIRLINEVPWELPVAPIRVWCSNLVSKASTLSKWMVFLRWYILGEVILQDLKFGNGGSQDIWIVLSQQVFSSSSDYINQQRDEILRKG